MPGPLWNSEEQRQFIGRLKGSSAAVFAVAMYHHKRGRTVEIPPLYVSENAADNVNNADNGDLFILGNGLRWRTEVKGLLQPRYHFTCADDFPMPHLFFSSESQVKRHNGNVHAYVVCNPKLTHAAVVRRSSSQHWYTVECKVTTANVPITNFCCPLQYAEFIQL